MWPGLLALVSIGVVAADQGGYFPTTWGWTSLAFLWVAGLTIVLRQTVRVSKAEALFLFAWAALLAWIALSTLWSTDLSETVLEVERTLVYVSAAAMFVLVCTGRSQRPLLGGLLCAIGAVSLFSLGTRLFPNVLRVYDPTAAKRLAQPLGYWNGLSAFTALGAVLAFGFAAHGRTLAVRAAAAALLVPLLATFYFTFGRSGWVALTAGFLVGLGLDRRPLRPLALLVALAPLLALDVWLSSRRPGLTHAHASLARAARDGHALALRLVILGLAAATVVAAFWVVERRIAFPRSVKIAFALLLAVACMAGAAVVFGHYGGPVSLTQRAWRNFKAPPSRAANLNNRLFTLSSNGRYQLWRIALDDAGSHPWLGSGAGSYERYFLRHQPAHLGRVRDAHSLYVETLAELGPFGLALLVVVLGTPVAVAVKRRRPMTAFAAGAYVVFLVHAATDWDWELPAVTLAALVCAVAMLLDERGARRAEEIVGDCPKRRGRRRGGRRHLCGCRSAREQCARDEPDRPGGREDRGRPAAGAACRVVGALVVRPVGQSRRCPGGGRHEGRGDRELSEGFVDRPERLEALVRPGDCDHRGGAPACDGRVARARSAVGFARPDQGHPTPPG